VTLVLAALAAQERRAALLPQVLAALRPQVDRLCVYLNGWKSVPECVSKLADEHVLADENTGAERKFHWADRWDGIYCSVDDDLLYPPDYVERMVDGVERTHRRAIVSVHGRAYLGRPHTVHQVAPHGIGFYERNVPCDRPINHAGTGVMAWDARQVRVPTAFPERNIADMQLAVWAQQNSVPMWLLKHEARWVKNLAPLDSEGLFRTSQRDNHQRRNVLLQQQGARQPWRIFEIE
jgi:hypothetical protein